MVVYACRRSKSSPSNRHQTNCPPDLWHLGSLKAFHPQYISIWCVWHCMWPGTEKSSGNLLKIGEKINGWLAIGAFGSVRNVTNVRSAFLCDICVRSYLAEIFGRVFGRVLPGFNWWLGIRWTSRHNELSHSRGCSQRHCQSDPSDKYMIQEVQGTLGPDF